MKACRVTPRRGDGTRLELWVSAEDAAKVERGHPWSATVTDIPSGERYLLKGATCESPNCFCDAIVVE